MIYRACCFDMLNNTFLISRIKNLATQVWHEIEILVQIYSNYILNNKSKFIDQDHSKATYAKKIDKQEGQINWNDDARTIIGKINGLFPVPGAFFNFNGERYKILKAEIGSGAGKVGEVISDYLEIACKNNHSIKILEIQRQGRRPQKISEFMLGSKIKKGLNLLNV